MGQKRDTQRARVYRAERAAFYGYNGSGEKQLLYGKSYDTLRGKRNRVKKIVSSKWWKKKSRASSIQVRHFDKQLYGGEAYTFSIYMGIREADEWVLIHELAHVLLKTARFDYSRKIGIPYTYDIRAHGRAYCRIFLALVRRFIGTEAYHALRLSFKKHNVKYARASAD